MSHAHGHATRAEQLRKRNGAARKRARASRPLRRRVLELLLDQPGPAKAYDLLPLLDSEKQAKPPTIYRALDFLVRRARAPDREPQCFRGVRRGCVRALDDLPHLREVRRRRGVRRGTCAGRFEGRRQEGRVRHSPHHDRSVRTLRRVSAMSHPAPLPAPLYQGSVNTWECDDGGHLNIRFHVERAMAGLAHFAHALEMPRAFTPASGSTLIPREAHIRFLKEARPGAPLVMHGGVARMGESDADLCLDMRHSDGAPSSCFTLKVAHVDTRGFRPFPWPARSRAAAKDWRSRCRRMRKRARSI